MELLTCKICGKQLPNLSGHVLHSHGMKGKEYKEKYGVDRLLTTEQSREMSKRRSEIKIETYKNHPELRQLRSIQMKKTMENKVVSQEEKFSKSLNNTTKPEWVLLRKRLYERSGGKCEICGILEDDLLKKNKNRLCIHEKNYHLTVPKDEDCVLCCKSCHKKLHISLSGNIRKNKLSRIIIDLVKTLAGEDYVSDNFIETPRRFASVLAEFSGIDIDFDLELEELANSIFESGSNGIISAINIGAYSLCPHHLLPVEYEISLAYLPQGYAVGVSKLARLCNVLAKKLQLQEHYTSLIADSIIRYLKTPDVAIITKGRHDCMRIRGIRMNDCNIVVSEMRGEFRNNPTLRAEFLSLIRL